MMTFKTHDFNEKIVGNVDLIHAELGERFPLELIAEQVRLERLGYERGEQKMLDDLNDAVSSGRITHSAALKPMVSDWMERFTLCLKALLDHEGKKPNASRRQFFYPLLVDVPVVDVGWAVVETVANATIEHEFTSLQAVASEVGVKIEEHARYLRLMNETGKWWKIHKDSFNERNSDNNRREYLKRAEAQAIREGLLGEWQPWDAQNVHGKLGVFLIRALCLATDYTFEESIVPIWKVQRNFRRYGNKTITAISVKTEVLDKVVDLVHVMSERCPKLLPCVIPPKQWTKEQRGGYWCIGGVNEPFVKKKFSIKQRGNVDDSRAMAAVNIIQNTGWKVNEPVLRLVQRFLVEENLDELTNSIDSWPRRERVGIQEIEPSLPVSKKDCVDEEQTIFWRKTMRGIYVNDKKRRSRRLSLEKTVGIADQFSRYDQFFFPYNCDFRGRIYSLSDGLNPQGDDVMKSLLLLSKGKQLGKAGWHWLRFHCATVGEIDGIHKKTPDERALWTLENLGAIMSFANDPFGDYKHFWEEADSPFSFYAACCEVRDAIHSGNPETFTSHLLVAFDGSCSGLQHYSSMTRDEVGGSEVNLIPSTKKADIYATVQSHVVEELTRIAREGDNSKRIIITDDGVEIVKPSQREMAATWLTFGISRTVCKRPVMTYFYSSREFGMSQQTLDDIIAPEEEKFKLLKPLGELGLGIEELQVEAARRKSCEAIFKDKHAHSFFLARLLYRATSKAVPKADEAMTWIQTITSLLMNEKKAVEWTTPDGFYVKQHYLVSETAQVQTHKVIMDGASFSTSRAQLWLHRTTDKFAEKQVSSVAPNLIHSMDACHLRMTVMNCHSKGVESFGVIHDSFGCLAADADVMFPTVRETLVEMYQGEACAILHQLHAYASEHLECEENINLLPPVPTSGKLKLEGITQSSFAFS